MIGQLVAGLVIGALARLIEPGQQHLSILATLLPGLVGSLIGGTIGRRRPNSPTGRRAQARKETRPQQEVRGALSRAERTPAG
jgi:hypothetical protein